MQTAEDLLKKYWGHSEFIFPQKEIIESVLNRKDTLAILPTGGGKSICFQIPALMFSGITLVISPLIALMQDQIKNLNQRGIPAEAITSQLNRDEIAVIIGRCILGKIKLLYVAPERLQSRFFLETLQNIEVSLIAVDEAHCISQWGFDFRPSYLKINILRNLFPNIPMLALTATAPPKTESEIISALELREVQLFKKSLKRQNLSYSVRHTQNEIDALIYELNKNPGSAIVFVRTRKKSFEVSNFLNEKGMDAQYFHSKLPKEEKISRQQIWTQSDKQIMVATNAFGMGIDKPAVRTVIHLNLPNSLEAYIQEAGRAGRDGLSASAVLFLQPFETEDLESIFKSGLPTKNEYEKIERAFFNYFEIGENERPEQKLEFDFHHFCQRFNLDKKKAKKIIDFLERKEVIAFKEKSSYSSVRVYSNPKYLKTGHFQTQIIESLVRKYPGILNDEKSVAEYYIAIELKKPVAKIKKQLKKMSESGYIYYRSKEIMWVKFRRPRESNYIKNTLWREFEAHQINQWKRLQDMIYYAGQKEVCREKLILRYFGEKPKEKCGKCDVCKTEQSDFDSERILEFIDENSKTIQEILIRFVNTPERIVLETLQKLLDERLIVNSGIDSFRKA